MVGHFERALHQQTKKWLHTTHPGVPWHISTDGSGGGRFAPKGVLTMVGAGAIGVQWDPGGSGLGICGMAVFAGGVPSTYPWSQTVPRAEAWGPLGLLEVLPPL